ncbi:flagellar protein FliT [Paraburkholderia strydomiana]|uniref:flagellar protein FliT n=1 Tax=Paraburkholderia strydomiana TaxID=1245417 RepID=UPI0038B769C8
MNQMSLIEDLLSLTQAIESAASLADWPEAARLTAQRSPLLMLLITEQTPEALALIRRIQAIDAAVLADASNTQYGLQEEYRIAMGRVSAVDHYQKAARL